MVRPSLLNNLSVFLEINQNLKNEVLGNVALPLRGQTAVGIAP
jgi:hypothetical protein